MGSQPSADLSPEVMIGIVNDGAAFKTANLARACTMVGENRIDQPTLYADSVRCNCVGELKPSTYFELVVSGERGLV